MGRWLWNIYIAGRHVGCFICISNSFGSLLVKIGTPMRRLSCPVFPGRA